MLALDESALICDLAETYGVLNYRALPVKLLATLCAGLRDDSRIKMICSGIRATPLEWMVAHAADNLSLLRWGRTEGEESPCPVHGAADFHTTQTVQMQRL